MPSGGHNIKPASQRSGRGTKDFNPRVVPMHKSTQPELDDETLETWPTRTLEWWKMWGRSPLTKDFTDEDWSELQDTALLHAFVWDPGNYGTPAWFKATAQLRQRTANYGATPLDRQRLRIQFVFAEEAEDKAEARKESQVPKTSTRQRRGPLKAV